MKTNQKGCLVQGTVISMADGTSKVIEDVVVGDLVKSVVLNQEEGIFEETVGTVVELQQQETELVYSLNEGLLIASEDHKHIVRQKTPEGDAYTERWIVCDTTFVVEDDKMMGADGIEITVTSKEEVTGTKTVHNLVIENHNTFIANGVITYNEILPEVTEEETPAGE
jgi:hypothetical protein